MSFEKTSSLEEKKASLARVVKMEVNPGDHTAVLGVYEKFNEKEKAEVDAYGIYEKLRKDLNKKLEDAGVGDEVLRLVDETLENAKYELGAKFFAMLGGSSEPHTDAYLKNPEPDIIATVMEKSKQ